MKTLLRYMTVGVALLQVQTAVAGNISSSTKTQTANSQTIDWNQAARDYQNNGNSAKDPVREIINNPYGQYFSQADIDRIVREKNSARKSVIVKGQSITVDTRDQETCLRIQDELLNSKDLKAMSDARGLCVQDNTKPMATIMVLSESDDVEWRKTVDTSKWTSNQNDMYTATRNVAIAAMGVAGALYLMPESVSLWNHQEMQKPGKAWSEHVKHGPVIDKDAWYINYVGHPYSGAAYYQVARHAGMGMMKSFGYSVIMSTFFWEFGVEAIAEKPSIQDLFLTPIIGSIFGEVFYRAEQKIIANDGKLLNSQTLGSVAMFLMNPMGPISNQINKAFGSEVVKDASLQMVVRKERGSSSMGFEKQPIWGLEVQFKF